MSAVVYGGRSPLALELCRQLADSGHEVHLATRVRDKSILNLGKENGCTEVHECDLGELDRSIALANKIDDNVGGLDAVAFMHRYRSSSPDPFEQFAIEVNTPYQILVHLAKRVRASQCSIVLATSPAAERVVDDQDFQYHASKAAISQLVRYGSVNFAKNNMRVNGVNPGTFVYKDRAASFYAEHPEVFELVKRVVPLGRMSNIQEIASVATFLLSAKTSNVNGQIINIDGGLSNRNLIAQKD